MIFCVLNAVIVGSTTSASEDKRSITELLYSVPSEVRFLYDSIYFLYLNLKIYMFSVLVRRMRKRIVCRSKYIIFHH
jgi:hypothetical protein